MKKVPLLLIPFILLIIPMFPQASTGLNTREEVFTFLKQAFEAQVELSEKERSAAEIKAILEPYFSEEYQKVFWKENIHKEKNGKYLTYGTDFARYYIPYYQFSNQTKVVFSPKKIYIYEYFPGRNMGPVGYKSHYEGLVLEKDAEKWKVNRYFYNQIEKPLAEKSLKKQIEAER